MNLSTWTIEQLQKRRAEIAQMADTAADEELDGLEAEARAIREELERRQAAESKRQQIRTSVANGAVNIQQMAAAPQQRERSNEEVRSTKEYAQAFINGIKTGDFTETRALLTEQVEGGYVPVPTALEREIKTAWEDHELLNRVKQSFFKGKVKIGFELSATGAEIHVEGTDATEEEKLVLGTVTIENQMIKKWITLSDETLEGTTVDTEGYIYSEIAHKITEKAEEVLVGKITGAPTTATSTSVSVAEMEVEALDVDTVTLLVAELSAKAKNPILTMNRRTKAALQSAAKKAKYAVDPFDGIEVVPTDQLKAWADAGEGDTVIIAGDFGYGAQANFPNGHSVSILKDPYSLAEKDLVKIVGREYVGMELVADKAFSRLKKKVTG